MIAVLQKEIVKLEFGQISLKEINLLNKVMDINAEAELK